MLFDGQPVVRGQVQDMHALQQRLASTTLARQRSSARRDSAAQTAQQVLQVAATGGGGGGAAAGDGAGPPHGGPYQTASTFGRGRDGDAIPTVARCSDEGTGSYATPAGRLLPRPSADQAQSLSQRGSDKGGDGDAAKKGGDGGGADRPETGRDAPCQGVASQPTPASQLPSLRPGLLFCGLRARGAVAWGELKGDAVAGVTFGMVVYRGRAWAAAEKLAVKAKAGEVRRRRERPGSGQGQDVLQEGGGGGGLHARVPMQRHAQCPWLRTC
jgi:hypothetical protein